MNILTKICVVVLLILVLVASVVFINMATVPQNYRQLYQQQVEKAKLADQAVRMQKLLNNRLTDELAAVRIKRDNAEKRIATMQQQSVETPQTLMVKQLTTDLNAYKVQLTELQASVKASGERNALLQKQLDGERTRIGTLQEQIARYTADATQLQGKLERSERVVRALEQQLRDRAERIAELEKQVRLGSAAETGTAVASTQGQVTGTITAVRDEHASINIGAAQGVTKGQKLYIYRNANFVGYLRIDEVDEGEAAGTVVDKQLDPVIGDKVTNDLMR